MKEKSARLKAAMAAIDRRTKEAGKESKAPRQYASMTDPDSRSMKDKEQRNKPNYNVQFVVDSGESAAPVPGTQPATTTDTNAASATADANSAAAPRPGTAPEPVTAPQPKGPPRPTMILACDANDAANDFGQIMEMVAQTQENCGRLPGEFSADAGYNTSRELATLEDQKIMAYISDKKDPIDTPQTAEAVAAVRQGFTLSLEQIGHLPAGEKDKLFDKCCFAYDVQTKRLVPQLQIALVSRLCAFLRTLTTTLHLFQLHLPASRPRRGRSM